MTGLQDKADLRRLAGMRRSQAHAAGQGAAARHLTKALKPWSRAVLAGYMPMRTEIDPLPAMSAHAGPVCVPVVMGQGQALQFRAWHPGVSLIRGAFGAQIPAAGDWLVPEVLIVPLLAYDLRGFRLGYGGGFYDRTLEALRAQRTVFAIGFAYAAQEVPLVPTEDTDQRLDLIVTENGPQPPT